MGTIASPVMEFLGVSVALLDGPMVSFGNTTTHGNLAISAKVEPRVNRIREIGLAIRVPVLMDGQFALVVRNGKSVRLESEMYLLNVPVRWDDNNGRDVQNPYPRTREKGVDNVDILIVDQKGHMRDIQISVVVRGRTLHVCMQKVMDGQVVRTRKDGKLLATVVPTIAEHNYPGFDYARIWPEMTDELVHVAMEESAFKQLSRTRQQAWNSPLESGIADSFGYWKGVVYYHNPITNSGEVEDLLTGQSTFFNYKAVNAKARTGEVVLLQPMQACYFKLVDGVVSEIIPAKKR